MAKIDFLNEAFIRNPFPVYHGVREKDPVYRFLLPTGQYAWIITRYDDAVKVLSDPRFITTPPHLMEASKSAGPPHKDIISRNLLSVNPADHRRLRRLIQKAFTPQMIEKLRSRIEEIANDLLDKVQPKGKINLIEDYAFPLPIIVICEMLGVPLEDQDKFRKWSDVIMEGVNNPQFAEQSENVMAAFVDYLQHLIASRRNNLQEDLISDLIRVEEDGDVLSEEEMYALVFVLIIAGHETTVNLIGNGVLALLEHPEQKAKLQHQPELIHSAVEEILRYDGPAEVSNIRWVTEDVELHGKTIHKGEMLLISFSSANRDKEAFDESDSFDITRETNHHLAFGKGVHYCLGAPLARLEGEIAISTLLQRMPELRLRESGRDSLQWRTGMIIRGVREIPLLF
ncbi:Cytochrome P450 [Evansella caseinilytica]|uniref:Cytochrome P450 n=1 Tax=Evansella caseinilytica TaxID=1503961 RepID=A0A1H3I3J8_9BACI|nr:cytochrome P450 [Evansella caseinilytica]SDY22230.1 Cytochrome P450 [Evansella caseinilytica]